MTANRKRRPDVSIAASAFAEELRFDAQPEVDVGSVGSGARGSRHSTKRRNIDSPARPGKVYRRVFAATEISGRLLDGDSQNER